MICTHLQLMHSCKIIPFTPKGSRSPNHTFLEYVTYATQYSTLISTQITNWFHHNCIVGICLFILKALGNCLIYMHSEPTS